jgi:hypothetical protein
MRSLTSFRSLPLLSSRSLPATRPLNRFQTLHHTRSVWLSRSEVLDRIDDHIRSHFPEEAEEVVEEVVRARNGIWAGLRGRKATQLLHSWLD